MNNPYTILDIKQDATDEEIEKARKRELKSKCSIDQNAKDENGEYLSDVINKAADNLLNKKRRKEIDERLNNTKNVPTIYSSSQLPSQIILTNINNELLKNKNKITLKKSFFGIFEEKVDCRKIFLGVLDNGECMYLYESCYDFPWSCLLEYFTGLQVVRGYKDFSEKPWHLGEIFRIYENLAFAYSAYRFLPSELIKNGKISKNTLRAILPILQEVLKNNIDELNKLFDEEQEKRKEKVGNK